MEENKVCCVDCGIKFLTDCQVQDYQVATFNKGICCVCGEEKHVTSIRHYNNLNPHLQPISQVRLEQGIPIDDKTTLPNQNKNS